MTNARRRSTSAHRRFFRLAFLCIATLVSTSSAAQDASLQRTFPVSVAEANAAAERIVTSSKGRLPTLQGFVLQSDQPIERYDKGYFECTFQILPAAGSGTIVRAASKITAWYTDPDAAHSGYRVLVSNGRLESDALDRMAETLTKAPASNSAHGPISAPVANALPRDPSRTAPRAPITSGLGISVAASSDRSRNVSAGTEASDPPRAGKERAISTRAADQKESMELSNYVKNLEEIQRNQAHPNDLAAVKELHTPVFAKPSESAGVILHAEAQDEFQVLGVDGVWVHVQISGASRGWIRRAQLEMPVGFSQAVGNSSVTPSRDDPPFKVAREETTPFQGNWAPLKGKPVRIEWVEPANPGISTSRKEKLAFAKSVFLHASDKVPNSQQVTEGIVVVFDSADGGQIAAPISSVKALADRTLSDSAFWHQCSIDPPELLLDSAKP
jgi:hypothetical protein